MKVLDLFSGIGGFSLGLERAGMQTIAFAETNDYASRVLAKHWPEVVNGGEVHSDSRFSMPGFERGRKTRRFDGQTIDGRFNPDWIIVENTGHRWRAWVPELRGALWRRGYASVPIRVRADWLGFSHRRARVFLVAHADSERLRKLARRWNGAGRQVAKELAQSWDSTPRRLGGYDGVPHRMDRLRCLGNAVVPQIAELLGRAILAIDNCDREHR